MSIKVNHAGGWWEVSKEEFLDMVKKGVVLPDTEIMVNDQQSVAAKVKGIVFPGNDTAASSQAVYADSGIFTPSRSIEKYFYTDANGTRRGPISEQQLNALASQGIIQPTTILEMESGKTETAKQIPGLTFGEPKKIVHTPQSASARPQPDSFVSDSFAPMKSQAEKRRRELIETEDSRSFFDWLFGWLLDFRFSNLQLQTTNLLQFQVIQLWLVRIFYAIYFVLTILSCIVATLFAFFVLVVYVTRIGSEGGMLHFGGMFDFTVYYVCYNLIFLPFNYIISLLSIIGIRIPFELCLLVVDWLVSARKAAKLYIANEQAKPE